MARLEKLDEQIMEKNDEIEKARENLKRKENQKKRLLSRQKEIKQDCISPGGGEQIRKGA